MNSILIGKQPGGYIHFEGDEHVGLYARTGSGKTSSMVIPNAFTWPGSLIVLDVKGEVFRATAGYRRDILGQIVYVFDPAANTGRSHRWSPLQAVDRKSVHRFDQISRQAFMLFPEATTTANSNADAFWTPSARGAFTSVATLLAETPEEDFNMAAVLRLFARGDSHDVLAEMIAKRRMSSRPGYSQAAVDGVSDYINGGTEQTGGIRKMTSTRLQSWFNPHIVAATNGSDFDLRDFRRKPMTIYITVAPANIDRLRPILALFFQSLINLNTDVTPQEDPTIKYQGLVILDEFARLGRMESLATSAQYVRGYGIRMLYVIQNKAQLRAIYGADAVEDIFDSIGAEIVFGTNDLKLTKELSERMGDNTVNVTTQNRPKYMAFFNWSKQSEAEHPHRRPLMLAQEVAQMDPAKQIILRNHMRPLKTDRAQWFSDPEFKQLALKPPIIPELKIEVPEDDKKTVVSPAKKLPDSTRNDVVTQWHDDGG